MKISEANYVIMVALVTLLMFFIFIFLLKQFIEDLLSSAHRKRFSVALRETLNSPLKTENSAWSVHQISMHWNQSEEAVLWELIKVLQERIENKASDGDIELIKDMIERQEYLSTISAVPMLLQPYVSELIRDGRYGGDKAKQLVRYIKNTEKEYAEKIEKQNRKTNLSLIIGLVGLSSLFWSAYEWIYEFFI